MRHFKRTFKVPSGDICFQRSLSMKKSIEYIRSFVSTLIFIICNLHASIVVCIECTSQGMFKGLLSLVLTIQFALNCAWKDCNCSLTFYVQTNDRLTKFPIELQGNYTFICPSLGEFFIDYVIIPFTTLPIGHVDDESYFVIGRNTTEWRFLVNESSTIRLCARPFNGKENDRLCREIHIGITELSHFWHLSLEIFYLCLLGVISTYYLIHYIVIPRCITRGKVKHPSRSVHRYRRTDTFEDEKVHSHMSDEE